jgi:hypothetical protein
VDTFTGPVHVGWSIQAGASMEEHYPIKDTFVEITTTLQAALDTDYVLGLLFATALISFIIGRMSK